MRERNLKIVIETNDICGVSPSFASYFKLHKCNNDDVSWTMILKNKMATIIKVKSKLFLNLSQIISCDWLATLIKYHSQTLLNIGQI